MKPKRSYERKAVKAARLAKEAEEQLNKDLGKCSYHDSVKTCCDHDHKAVRNPDQEETTDDDKKATEGEEGEVLELQMLECTNEACDDIL